MSACRSCERCRHTGWRVPRFCERYRPAAFQKSVALAVRSRLGQETSGLVDNEDIAIFEKDLEPPRGRLGSRAARVARPTASPAQPRGGVKARLAGDIDLSAADRSARRPPRQAELLRDSLIQTHE